MKTAIAIAATIAIATAGIATLKSKEEPSISPTELTIKHGRDLPKIEANGI